MNNQNDKFYFTAAQLIEILKAMPQDLPVLVSGYESDYENFYHPVIRKMKHKPDTPYFEGEFQPAQDGDKETFDAVILARVVRDD